MDTRVMSNYYIDVYREEDREREKEGKRLDVAFVFYTL